MIIEFVIKNIIKYLKGICYKIMRKLHIIIFVKKILNILVENLIRFRLVKFPQLIKNNKNKKICLKSRFNQ